jgi:uncharacterized phage protein gp47/JayE
MTPQGFLPTTVEEEVTELGTKFQANIDNALDLAPDQPIGQTIGIFAEKYAELTELGATIYNALNPNAAEGQLLTNVSAISGTYRQIATFSLVGAELTLNASTTVHAGATAVVLGQPQNVWVLQHDVTSTTAGVYLGTFQSQVVGPFAAPAGTLTVIGTPTIGWLSVTNIADAVQGLPGDTDTTLRQKRALELLGEGAGDLDAIRAAVLKVGGVQQCFVYENTSLVTDTTGLPGKSFRVVIWDGIAMSASNNAVAQAIWNTKPSGILSFGTGANSGVATDSTGAPRTILFDRAVQVPIYVSCTTTPSSLTSPQRTTVKAAFAAYALANYTLGTPVIALALRAAGLVPGVTTDLPTFTLGTAPAPVGTANIPISGLQIATLDTANILVNGL